MSRIGKKPIVIPAGVSIEVGKNNVVTVKGPKGTLSQTLDRDITPEIIGNSNDIGICRRGIDSFGSSSCTPII